MELFTNILIWIGILTAVVVIALAIHEFIWKPRQEGGTAGHRQRDQEATPSVVTARVVKQGVPAGPVDSSPPVEPPAEPVERL